MKHFSINLIMQKHPKILMPIHIIIQCFYRESSIVDQRRLSQKKAFGHIIRIMKNSSTLKETSQFYSLQKYY